MRHVLLAPAFLACVGSVERMPTLHAHHDEGEWMSANYTSSQFRTLTDLLLAYSLPAAFTSSIRRVPHQDASMLRAVSAGRQRFPEPGMQTEAPLRRPRGGETYTRIRERESERLTGKKYQAPIGDRRRTAARPRPVIPEEARITQPIQEPLRPLGRRQPMNPETKRRKGIYGPAGERNYIEQLRVSRWLRWKFRFNKMEAADITTKLRLPNKRAIYNFLGQAEKSSDTLQQIFGLSDLELGEIVMKRPSLLKMTEDLQAELEAWKELGLADLVVATPNAYLQHSLEEEVMPMIAFLEETVGLNFDQVYKLLRNRPNVLSSIQTARPMVAALRKVFAFSEEDVKAMVMRRSQLLFCSIEENIRPLVAGLSETLGLSDTEIRDIVLQWPNVLNLNMENISQTLDALGDVMESNSSLTKQLVLKEPSLLQLDVAQMNHNKHMLLLNYYLTQEEFVSVLLREPSILSLNYTAAMKQMRDGMREVLGFTPEAVHKIIYKEPLVMSLNFEQRVVPVIETLRETLGMELSEIRRIIKSEPSILTKKASRNGGPRARLSKLQELLELSDKNLHKLALQQPSLLVLDVRDELIPRVDLLQAELPLSKMELGSEVLRCPKVLLQSLDSMQHLISLWKQALEHEGLDLQAEVLKCGLTPLAQAPRVQMLVELAREKGFAASPIFGKLDQSNTAILEFLEQPVPS